MDVRLASLRLIAQVLNQEGSLMTGLPKAKIQVGESNAALLQALTFGALRHYGGLRDLFTPLLQQPFKRKDQVLEILLVIALYQLIYLRTPDHAVLHESVKLLDGLKRSWAKGLVNALLRQIQRQRDENPAALLERIEKNPSHPDWLIQRLRTAWGIAQARTLLKANQQQAPMTLRLNLHWQSREAYLAQLEQAGIVGIAGAWAPGAIRLEKAVEVDAIPGFAEGFVSVQDEAAQLAAELLDPQNGETLLDACAAPGGKTGHLLEKARGQIALTAADLESERLARVAENLSRLKVHATLVQADLTQPHPALAPDSFDAILLDAPCSATGVIRRHPDIKYLRRESDMAELTRIQGEILRACWRLLKPGGRLLYATCSVLPEENSEQVCAFLAQHPDAIHRPILADWGLAQPAGRQLLTGQEDTDGFYYALLVKNHG
jgi:16S rRNA (cytosine967-C5)-methyltransferase